MSVDRFFAVLGPGRGLPEQHTLLSRRPDAAARRNLDERDDAFAPAQVADDIAMLWSRRTQFAERPLLGELAGRLPARLTRMVEDRYEPSLRAVWQTLGLSVSDAGDHGPVTFWLLDTGEVRDELRTVSRDHCHEQLTDILAAVTAPDETVVFARAARGFARAFAPVVGEKLHRARGEDWLLRALTADAAEFAERYGVAALKDRYQDLAACVRLAGLLHDRTIGVAVTAEQAHSGLCAALIADMNGPSPAGLPTQPTMPSG